MGSDFELTNSGALRSSDGTRLEIGARLLPLQFPSGVLRRMRQSDLAAFQEYRRIPELGRFQSWSPMGEAEALAFLAEMESTTLFQPGPWVQLAIAEPGSGVLIGDSSERLGFRCAATRAAEFRGEACTEQAFGLSATSYREGIAATLRGEETRHSTVTG